MGNSESTVWFYITTRGIENSFQPECEFTKTAENYAETQKRIGIPELDRKVNDLKIEQAAKDEMLLPPKSIKNEYLEQTQAKFVFKCKDGDIQIPEYGILRTEFYYQVGIVNLESLGRRIYGID